MKKIISILILMFSIFSILSIGCTDITNLNGSTLNGNVVVCAGTYNVNDINIIGGSNITFEEGTVIYTDINTRIFAMEQDNVNFNCNNTNLVSPNFNSDNNLYTGFYINANNVNIENCYISNSNIAIRYIYGNSESILENIKIDFSTQSLNGVNDNTYMNNIEADNSFQLFGNGIVLENSNIEGIILGHSGQYFSGELNNNIIGDIELRRVPDTYLLLNVTENDITNLEVTNFFGDFSLGNIYFYNNIFNTVDDSSLDYDNNEFLTYCNNNVGNTYNTYIGNNPNEATCEQIPEEETNFVNIILGIFVFLFITAGLIMASGGFETLIFTDNIGALLSRMLLILLSAMILSKLVLVALT